MKNNIVKSFCLLLLIVLGALQIDAQKYAVSFNYNSGGTIRDNFQNVKLTGTVDSLVAGSSVNYFISYNQGFILDSFFVNDSLVTKTNSSFYYYSITNIRKNYNLRFVFKQQGWSVVNISYNSGGTVYFDFGTGLSKSNNIIYNRQVFSGTADSVREGDTAGYLFIPDNNYIVDSLFVDGVYQTNIATDNSNNLRYLFLNVSGNHSIRMVFNVRAPYYRINRSNSPGGSIVLNNLALPPTGYDSFASGSTQRYSFVANQGYVVDSVFVNNTYIPDSVTGYTFRNISNNQNLRVVFDTNFVRLRISSNYGGCINLNYGEKFCGPISIDTNKVNGSYYFTINSFNNVHILDSNYYIDSVIINGISQNLLGYNQRGLDTGFGTFTFFTANITANYDLRVVYKQYPKYVLTVNYNYGDNNQFRYYKNYFNNINLPSSGFYKDTLTLGNRRNYFSLNGLPDTSKYYIDSVTVNGVRAQSSLTNINISQYIFQNTTINIVNKLKPQYIVNITSNYGGSISPKNTDTLFKYSSSTYSIFPNYENGYVLDSVFVNGIYLTNNMIVNGVYLNNRQNIIISSIISNVNIRVVFRALNKYFINVSWKNGGSVNSSGRDSLYFGQSRTYYFTPDNLYAVDSVFVNNQYLPNQTTNYSFNNVSSNNSLRVVFKFRSINTVSINYNTGGSVRNANYTLKNPGSLDTFLQGSTYIYYSITPNSGYLIDSFLVNDSLVTKTNANTYTYRTDTIKKNYNLRVVFRQQGWSVVNISYNTGGSVYFGSSLASYNNIIYNRQVISGAQDSIREGDTAAYLFIPNNNFIVDSLFVDGVYQTSFSFDYYKNLRYLLDNITGNHSIRVVFKQAQNYIITINYNYGVNNQFRYSSSSNKYFNAILPSNGYFTDTLKQETFRNNFNLSGSPDTSIYYIDSVTVNGVRVQSTLTYLSFLQNNINQNTTINIVNKLKPRYVVNVTSNYGGNISSSDTLIQYTNANYYFTPFNGYVVDSVFVNNVYRGVLTNYFVNSITSNVNIRVVFRALPKYTISFIYNTGGSVRDANYTIKNSGSIDTTIQGNSVYFYIIPYSGYIIDSFLVNDSLVTKTRGNFYYSISNIQKNYNLRVVFRQLGWSVVNITYNAGGTVYQGKNLSYYNNVINNRQVYSGSQDSILEGDTAAYLFIPNNNYIVDSIFIDGVYQDTFSYDNQNNLRYIFRNLSGNHSIRVVFNVRAPYYRITRSNSPGGSIVLNNLALPPTGYDSFASGSTQRYSFVANQGYVVDSVFVNGTYNPDSITGYTFRNINSNQNLRVRFKINSQPQLVFVVITETDTTERSYYIPYNSNYRVTYTPLAGQKLDSVLLNNNSVSKDSTNGYTLYNVISNQYLTLYYSAAAQYFRITRSNSSGGSIVLNNLTLPATGYDSFASGSTQRYSFVANQGYVVDSVFVNGTYNPDSITGYTFRNISSNQNLRVRFKINSQPQLVFVVITETDTTERSYYIPYNSNYRVTYTPFAGQKLDSVLLNNNSVSKDSTNGYTLYNVISNQYLTLYYSAAAQYFRITRSNSSGGSIVLNNLALPATGYDSFASGSTQRYSFVANQGYVVDSVFVNGTYNPDSITGYTFRNISSNQNLRVRFKINSQPQLVFVVITETDTTERSYYIPYNSNYRVTYTPLAGQKLDSVLLNNNSVSKDSTNGYTLYNVISNQYLTLYYSAVNINRPRYQITTSVVNGQITPSFVADSSSTIRINYYTTQIFRLDSIFINGVSQNLDSATGYTFSVNNPINIRVVFKQKPYYSITSTSNNGGIIISNNLIVGNGIKDSVLQGGSKFYTFQPITGYIIDSLIVNDTVKNVSSSYVFSNVQSNQTLRVVFKLKPRKTYIITTSVSNGNITPSFILDSGRNAVILYQSLPNYVLNAIYVDGNTSTLDSANKFTFNNLNANHTIRVEYRLFVSPVIVKSVNIISNGNGNICRLNNIPNFPANCGTNFIDSLPIATPVTYFIQANYGYSIDSIRIFALTGSTLISRNFNDTFSLILNDIRSVNTIQVYFKRRPARLMYLAYGTNNNYSGDGGQIYSNNQLLNSKSVDTAIDGTSLLYFIQPATGYIIDSIFINNLLQPLNATIVIPNVISNNNIRVKFRTITTIVKTFNVRVINNTRQDTSTISIDSGGRLSLFFPDFANLVLDTIWINANGYRYFEILNADRTFVLSNIRFNVDVFVRYKPQIYTLNISGKIGNLIFNEARPLVANSNFRYVFPTILGYVIDSVFVNGSLSDSNLGFSFYNVLQNQIIRLVYDRPNIDDNYFNISTSIDINGRISPSTTLPLGRAYTVFFAPQLGYEIDSVFVNDIYVDTAKTSYQIRNLNQNYRVNVKTKVRNIRITLNVATGGGVYINNQWISNTQTTLYIPYNTRIYGYIKADSLYRIDTFIANNFNFNYSLIGNFIIKFFVPFEAVLLDSVYNITIRFSKIPVPNKPIIDTVIAGNGSALIQFRANHSSSHYAIDYFIVKVFPNQKEIIVKQSPVYISNLINGISYKFTVTAVNEAGKSVPSDSSKAIIPNPDYISISTQVLGGNGNITPSHRVRFGAADTIVFKAETGFEIANVFVDGSLINSLTGLQNAQYILNDVRSNRTINVLYRPRKIFIYGNISAGGVLNINSTYLFGNGLTSVDYDSQVQFNIIPDLSYGIDSIWINGIYFPLFNLITNITGTNYFIINSLKENIRVKINFRKTKFQITTQSKGDGYINPNGNILLNKGGSQKIYFSAYYGAIIDSVFVNGILRTDYIKTSANNQGFYQFKNIQGDSNIRVIFKRQNYTIRVGSNNSSAGAISPAGVILVPVNGNQNINIFARNNYRIDSIFVNNRKINLGISQNYFAYYFNQVRGDSTIFVYFSKEFSTIISNTNVGGNVYPLGFVTARFDDTIYYNFIPEPGYALKAIILNGDTVLYSGNSYEFTNISTDQSIEAIFEQQPNGNGFSNGNISFAALPTYFISSSSNLNNLLSIAGKNIYDSGTTAIYTIYLPTNYQIDSVIIDGVNTTISGNTVRFSNLNANHTLRVVVSSLKYNISISATEGGYLLNPSSALLNLGDDDTLNFVANTGYIIDSVIVDGILQSENNYTISNNVGTYIFNNIDANHTIRVSFKPSTYTITVQANQGGSVDVNGKVTLNLGEAYTTNFSANAGYTIAKVIVDGAVVYNTNGRYTFSDVSANHTIQIEFSFAQYKVTQQNYLNNSLLETDTTISTLGSSVTNTIINIPGYHVNRVVINGIEINKTNLTFEQGEYFYTFNNIRGDSNIKVYYLQDLNIQTIAVNGTITPSVTTPLGGHVTITYQGLTGYIISKIFIGGIDQGNDLSLGYGQNSGSYQFINLRQNDSIRVVFIPAPIPADFITISAISPNCYSENAVGSIVVKAQKAAVYRFNIKGTSSTNFSTFWFNDTVYSLNNLTVGNYDVCVTDTSKPNLNRCFTVSLTAPQPISAFSIVDNAHKTIDVKVVQGQVSYINLNGNLYNSTNNLPLQNGVNTIVVKSTPGCLDSILERVVLAETLLLYPNPAADIVNLSVGGVDEVVGVAIYTDQGFLVLDAKGLSLDNNGKITLQISHLVKKEHRAAYPV